MTLVPDYQSADFAQMLAEKTSCGANAWQRLMSWSTQDTEFKAFLDQWTTQVAPAFYAKQWDALNNQPQLASWLQAALNQLFSAQFIFRIYQIASAEQQAWLSQQLTEQQASMLQAWHQDASLDQCKAKLTDQWDQHLTGEYLYQGVSLTRPLRYEVFSLLSRQLNTMTKKLDR